MEKRIKASNLSFHMGSPMTALAFHQPEAGTLGCINLTVDLTSKLFGDLKPVKICPLEQHLWSPFIKMNILFAHIYQLTTRSPGVLPKTSGPQNP